jgi:putative membrane protein
MMMGLADLIPGISGGSVAFISGIYKELLDTIHAFGRFKFSLISPHFFFPLLAGVLGSSLLFSHPINFLLTYHLKMTYALFLSAMLYSVALFFQQASLSTPKAYGILVLGVVLTVALTLFLPQASSQTLLWVLFAGFCGALAMLAPGISGSYVLCVLGVYPKVVYALSHLSEIESFRVLGAFFTGMIGGLIVASTALRYFLKHYPSVTVALLGGALVGGVPTLMLPIVDQPFLLAFSFFGAYLLYRLTPTSHKGGLETTKLESMP